MKILDDIHGLISSEIPISHSVEKTKINKKVITDLRKISNPDNLNTKILELDFDTIQKLEDFCVYYSYTAAERNRLEKYCHSLVIEGNEKHFSIRLENAGSNDWVHCRILKDETPFGNVTRGAFDPKIFKIPVNAAIKILNISYIPFFYNDRG